MASNKEKYELSQTMIEKVISELGRPTYYDQPKALDKLKEGVRFALAPGETEEQIINLENPDLKEQINDLLRTRFTSPLQKGLLTDLFFAESKRKQEKMVIQESLEKYVDIQFESDEEFLKAGKVLFGERIEFEMLGDRVLTVSKRTELYLSDYHGLKFKPYQIARRSVLNKEELERSVKATEAYIHSAYEKLAGFADLPEEEKMKFFSEES